MQDESDEKMTGIRKLHESILTDVGHVQERTAKVMQGKMIIILRIRYLYFETRARKGIIAGFPDTIV